ncbi:hypothetical protein FKM82_025980 [Ascaphus truei]
MGKLRREKTQLLQQVNWTSLRAVSSPFPWFGSTLVWMPQIPYLQDWLQPPYDPHEVDVPSSSRWSEHLNLMLLAAVSSPSPCGDSTLKEKEMRLPLRHQKGEVHEPQLREKEEDMVSGEEKTSEVLLQR